MKIDIKDLKENKSGIDYESGYRIVYFYDDKYVVGEYCKTIEGFMTGFAKSNPIMELSDIPEFISTKDLLKRYLDDVEKAKEIAIYNINGECIDIERQNNLHF